MMFWLACAEPTTDTDASATVQDVQTSTFPGTSPSTPPPAPTTIPTDPAGDPLPAAADQVESAPGADDLPFGDPTYAINGVRGGGTSAGGIDVYALDAQGEGAALIVRWTDRRLLDGPGVDLVVFENAFEVSPGHHFMDPTLVSVSIDGVTWIDFPADRIDENRAEPSDDPTHWVGFAGLTPVQLHAEANAVDPFDADAAGGDGFDLGTLDPSDPDVAELLEHGVAAVRLRSASAVDDPATGAPWPTDPVANGADIDGVWGRVLVWE